MYYKTVKGVIQLFFKIGFFQWVSIAQTNTLTSQSYQKSRHSAAQLMVQPVINPMLKLYYTPISLNSHRRARWHFWKSRLRLSRT
ncbi:hypothetical protein [Microcoleus sp.]|uniref:hypothetical protein n=1 Tax=Microcoleus sp. TaxID=44472 RepID=UPI0035944675